MTNRTAIPRGLITNGESCGYICPETNDPRSSDPHVQPVGRWRPVPAEKLATAWFRGWDLADTTQVAGGREDKSAMQDRSENGRCSCLEEATTVRGLLSEAFFRLVRELQHPGIEVIFIDFSMTPPLDGDLKGALGLLGIK